MTTEAAAVTAPQAQAPAPGTPEYDAAMVAKFDAHQAGQGANTKSNEEQQRPEWLPENFKSPEDLAKSYKEAQAELTRLKQAAASGKTPEAPKVDGKAPEGEAPKDTPPADPEAAKVAAESAGVDYNSLAAEYAKNGTLSEEAYTKLAKAGIDKDIVDTYIAGQEAIAAQRDAALLATVGGQDQFKAMAAWAANGGMSAAEIAAFDNATANGTEAEASLALQGLKARYEAVRGRNPTLVTGASNSTAAAGFRSTAEMTAAMRDPRYAKDPAYRADVEARVAASTAF